MIEIKNLTHSLGGKTILSDINFSVEDGCVIGIVGINGAGKTTLLRLLSGVYIADGGEILYDGKSPAEAATRRDIFFLPDDPYYTTHSTPENLLSFYKALYPCISEEDYFAYLKEYQIDKKGNMRNFSKGMKRQVFISLALAVKPKYLLLDEAFDGLDPLSRKIFKDSITKFIEEEGATVLISSHSLRELEYFSDKFILIDGRTVKEQGNIAEHVGKLCKFELAFNEPKSKEMFANLPIVSVSVRGRFVTVVLECDYTEAKTKLQELSPLVMEEMPINFEEAFIYDVERKDNLK